MNITLKAAAELLKQKDKIYILSHHYPDGDTLGSASALCMALQKMGKQVRCLCEDEISKRYAYLFAEIIPMEFEPEFIVSVDVAAMNLLGVLQEPYENKIDLCIDHHASNSMTAKALYVDSNAGATCEIICKLIQFMEVEIDSQIATCIYTGISTDTGCFRYPNATAQSYRIAADMIEAGANAAEINRLMFDTKSRARMEMERSVMDTMEFFCAGKCGTICISRKMIEQTGAQEGDLEGLSSLPRQVEGVMVGITFRERRDGGYKISLRTQPPIDASVICSQFGGGGHKGAAGCTILEPLATAKEKLVNAVENYLKTI